MNFNDKVEIIRQLNNIETSIMCQLDIIQNKFEKLKDELNEMKLEIKELKRRQDEYNT